MTTTHELDPELSLLLRMRERLSDPAHWYQGEGAQSEGESPSGARCLIRTGALIDIRAWELYGYERLASLAGVDELAEWNDSPERNHADILRLLDTAIAKRTAELAETETA